MGRLFARFTRDERGATVIEYGLIAALIAVVCLTAFAMLGGSVDNLYTHIITEIRKALGG